MYLLSVPFPYLSDKKGEGNIIKGELYEIDKSKKIKLDFFEGCPDLYKTGFIDVVNKSNCYFHAVNKNQLELKNLKLINEFK